VSTIRFNANVKFNGQFLAMANINYTPTKSGLAPILKIY
jgi:hypothetical protein